MEKGKDSGGKAGEHGALNRAPPYPGHDNYHGHVKSYRLLPRSIGNYPDNRCFQRAEVDFNQVSLGFLGHDPNSDQAWLVFIEVEKEAKRVNTPRD